MEFNSWLTKYDDFVKIQIKTSHVNFFEIIKLFVKSPKLKAFTLSWTKIQGTIEKLG
jgi:hypothetical protein